MIKEEAIKMIENDIRIHHDFLSGKYRQALTMAVEALKEKPKGEWVGVQEYCKHLEEKTGERYAPTGLGKLIYCNQCWQANDRRSAYCPDCGADMRSKIVGKHADFMMMDEAVVKGADDE